MPAYCIAELKIFDQDAYARYKGDVTAVVESFGGRFLIRGDQYDTVEGEWNPDYLVMIEFPDRATFHRFYDSPEYQGLKADRLAFAQTNVVIFEGWKGE